MANRLPLLALLFFVTCRAAWAQLPAGAEFQVNSYTTNEQRYPVVASDAAGNFVVVWDSRFQDGSWLGIFGQRFDASGLALGAEFQVNSYTTGFQGEPSVAPAANGDFVVAWSSTGEPDGLGTGQDGSVSGVFGQRFNASGVPQGSEFQVNSYTTSYQNEPAVASDANGNFVVVWRSHQDGFYSGVFGQRFNASGVPQGSEFQVNSYTTSYQGGPSVASDVNGNFVVVWTSDSQDGHTGQDGSVSGVFGQRFNSSGLPLGTEFQVNSYTTGHQLDPEVASDANGNFVVVWRSHQDGFYSGVFGQRFNASGVPQGSEFQVNTYTTGIQALPAVASDASGNFVVAWTSFGDQDGSGLGVFSQRFNASGVPQGAEFQVNSYTTGSQVWPAVTSDANGNFVVAWTSTGQDGDGWGIFGQRFGDVIFKNGFQ